MGSTRTEWRDCGRRPEGAADPGGEVACPDGADAAQGMKSARVAAVGCGGEEQHEAGPDGERVCGSPALTVACRAVRLVYHHGVPAHVRDTAPDFGALGEIDRCHANAGNGPGIDCRRQHGPKAAQPGGVGDDGFHAESVRQLGAPLIAEARWREHEHAVEDRARSKLGQHEARFDRLAETDRVGKEESSCSVANHRQGGFELMGEQVEAGTGRRSQGVRLALAEDGGAQRSHPGASRDGTNPAWQRLRLRPVERRQQDEAAASLESGVAGRGRLEVELTAIGMGHDGTQQPPPPAHPHEGARLNCCVQELPPPTGLADGRNCHPSRAAGRFAEQFRSRAARWRIPTQGACYSRRDSAAHGLPAGFGGTGGIRDGSRDSRLREKTP